MRYLYYCNSAYQMLNALNLNWHRKYANFENIDNYEADLVMLDAFKDAKEFVEILNKNKYFDKVTLVKRNNNKGLFHSLKSVIGIINPKEFLIKAGYEDPNYLVERYDYIVAPKFSKATAAIWQLNKNAKLQLYEDGLGTYLDTVELESKSKTYIYLYKLFNHGRSFDDFDGLYLNEPNLYSGNYNKIASCPKFDNTFLNSLQKEFAKEKYDENKNVIWLGQFIKDDVNDITEKVLTNYKNISVYRPHPRYKLESSNIDISKNDQMWELSLLNTGDINNKCFITIHSTAVFTPKLLFNFEPTVILTYKTLSNKVDKNFNDFVDRFIKIYGNKNKIMVPNNKQELEECVNRYLNDLKKTNKMQ